MDGTLTNNNEYGLVNDLRGNTEFMKESEFIL